MNNISGSAKNWINDDNSHSKKINNVVEIIERPQLDDDVLINLIKKLEDVSSEINGIYKIHAKKSLSDTSVLINSAISSLYKDIMKN